jgi:hypothetical protein
MRLRIEDKIGRALLLGKGFGLKKLALLDGKEPPEDGIHGQQGGRHSTRGLQKISTRETSSSGGPFHERDGERFNAGLVCCLAEGSKFFVRHDLHRNGGSKGGSWPSRWKVWKW